MAETAKSPKQIEIVHEVALPPDERDFTLTFQQCVFHYENADGTPLVLDGYRFMWRKPNGKFQTALGQARIPDAATLFALLKNRRLRSGFLQVRLR